MPLKPPHHVPPCQRNRHPLPSGTGGVIKIQKGIVDKQLVQETADQHWRIPEHMEDKNINILRGQGCPGSPPLEVKQKV